MNVELQRAYDQEGWFVEEEVRYADGMDFEKIADNDLEEEDDMNAIDAAFMRGYINHRPRPAALYGRD